MTKFPHQKLLIQVPAWLTLNEQIWQLSRNHSPIWHQQVIHRVQLHKLAQRISHILQKKWKKLQRKLFCLNETLPFAKITNLRQQISVLYQRVVKVKQNQTLAPRAVFSEKLKITLINRTSSLNYLVNNLPNFYKQKNVLPTTNRVNSFCKNL